MPLMTRAAMKEMATADGGVRPWEVLTAAVASGWEYPEAVWQVTLALRLPEDEVEQMERDYDELA